MSGREVFILKKFLATIFIIIAGLAAILSAVTLVRDPSLIEKLPPYSEIRPYFLWSIGALSLAIILLACIRVYKDRKPRVFVPNEPPQIQPQNENNNGFNPRELAASLRRVKHGSGKSKERDLLS